MRNSVSHGKVWVYSLEDIIGERKLIVATTFLDRAGTPPAAVRGLQRFFGCRYNLESHRQVFHQHLHHLPMAETTDALAPRVC